MNRRVVIVAVVLASAIMGLFVVRWRSATNRTAPRKTSAADQRLYRGPLEQKQYTGWVFGRLVGVNADTMSPFRTPAPRGR